MSCFRGYACLDMRSLLATLSLTIMASAASLAGEPFAWGVNGHPFSQESYFHVPIKTQLDLLSELGATWYRVDLNENAFPGNTERFEELLRESARRGIHVLAVLFPSSGARDATASPAKIRDSSFAFARAF